MKSIVNRIAVLLLVSSLASPLVLAKTTSKEVTFQQAISVNGTLLNKGTYNVTFNDETGELTFKKGKKVVATAGARLERTDSEGSYTRSESTDPTKPPFLVNVLLSGGQRATIVEKEDKTATSVRP